MVLKEVGVVYGNPSRDKERDKDDEKTLDELHFETGDYLDVAIFTN